jgi:hypothetical protein
MDGKFDANQVAVLVKQHFEKIGNIFLFRIEKINYNTEKSIWIVECSFFDALFSNKRIFYRVEIDSKDGKFISENKIEET